jgi:signal peptidase
MQVASFFSETNSPLVGGHRHIHSVTRMIRFGIGIIIAVTVFATLFLAFISARTEADAAGPHLFGRHYLVVRSGSMSPSFATGSMVAIKQTNSVQSSKLPVGTVVAFRSLANPEVLITHRIVGTVSVDGKAVFQTKGDANATVDGSYLEPERILGMYSFSVPRLGFFMVALQGRQFLLTLTAAFSLASISMMLTHRASALTTKKENQK